MGRAFRENARRGGSWCRHRAGRGWRGFIYAITSAEVITALYTASIFGVISSYSEALSVVVRQTIIKLLGWYFPVKFYTGGFLLTVFAFAYWAKFNREAWREMVEEATGEETADDEDPNEDEA